MKILYVIFRFKSLILSRLPLGILYFFSGFLAFLINHIVSYRKKVIVSNLKNSFPEKSITEIRKLTNAFYKNLADLFFEIIKLESISKKELLRRVSVDSSYVLQNIAKKKQGAVVVMSHTGNWEWISQRVCFEGIDFDDVGVIAKEMTNPYFEHYFTRIRLRLQKGIAEIIPFKDSAKFLAGKRHKASMIIAIADQSPHKDQILYRTTFLNQDTGVFLGPERIACVLNYAVVFCHVKQTKRGFYHISFELITDTPYSFPEHGITDTHVRMLEDDINKQPETWLWSHRRWKY